MLALLSQTTSLLFRSFGAGLDPSEHFSERVQERSHVVDEVERRTVVQRRQSDRGQLKESGFSR